LITAADYLSTFVSIVLGVALADLATSLHRLLRARSLVRWDFLAPMAAFGAMLVIVMGWWELYDNFAGRVALGRFLMVLLSLLLLFLLAASALPDEVPAEGIDLRAYYLDNRTYFWGIFALFLLSTIVTDIRDAGAGGWRAILLEARFKVLFMPLACWLMWTRQPLVHGAVLVAMMLVATLRLHTTVGFVR
jgi:hypothetical protein